MKLFLSWLWKKKIVLLIVIISSFLFGYTTTNIYNQYLSTYVIEFQTTETITFDDFVSYEFLLSVQQDFQKKDNHYYDDIPIAEIVNNKDIKITYQEDKEIYTLKTKAKHYSDFYLKSSKSVSTRAKTFLKTALNKYAENKGITISILDKNILRKESPLSQNWVIGISSCCLICFSSLCIGYQLIIFKRKKEELFEPLTYERIYKTPFHLDYWKDSLKVFKSTKNITSIAMILGIMMITKAFSLPSGFGNMGISLTYIVFAIGSMIYGPIAGLVIGTISDTLGFILYQSSQVWFIGYTIQSALTGFIYGLLFYKQDIRFSRIFIARILVSLFMNVILGSICWGIVAKYTVQQTLFYALTFVLPKNIVYLFPQTFALYIVVRALLPGLIKLEFLEEEQRQTISKYKINLSLKETKDSSLE